MKQTILYVITKSNWGGAQKYVYDLATSIDQHKFEVIVAHGGNGDLVQKLAEAGISTVRIPHLERDVSFFREIKVFRSLISLYKKYQPNIVHLNSSKIGGLGSFAGRIAKVPSIIFTAHGWAFNETQRSSLSRFIIKIASWLTILFSHYVITLSDIEKNQVEHWPLTLGKIHVIPTGIAPIDALDKKTAREELIKIEPRLKNHIETKWIGTIAELHANKGLSYAIKAFYSHNIPYIVIGEGEERTPLEREIKKHGMEDRVFLIGAQTNASRYLKAFDLFLFPSTKEGFPYTLLEAGLVGIPIISTDVGGIPELISHNNLGTLISAENSKEINKTISLWENNPEIFTQKAHLLQTMIAEKYTLNIMVEKTTSLYTQKDL